MEASASKDKPLTPDTPTSSTSPQEDMEVTETLSSNLSRTTKSRIASDPKRAAQAERDMEILAPRGVIYTKDTPTSSTSQQGALGAIETLWLRLSRTTKSRMR
jgi:hypothetical protein